MGSCKDVIELPLITYLVELYSNPSDKKATTVGKPLRQIETHFTLNQCVNQQVESTSVTCNLGFVKPAYLGDPKLSCVA